jgi:Cu/Ag efflux pump CusA
VTINGKEGLLLGDVARVVEDHQPLIGDAILGDGSGLLLVIEKFPGANPLEVTRGVEAALKAMEPGLQGIEIDPTVFRPANYIEQAIRNLSTAVLIGAVLVVLVLGAFFFHWRTALISLVAIPLSLVAAAFVLYLRGETFNTMTLAGLVIALGAIIDSAIIDVENVARRLRQHRQENGDESPASIVLEATVEMRSPLLFALLIILLAVTPLFFIPGLTGSFLRPLVISYVLALLASLAVALIVTPALSLTLLADTPAPDGRQRRESPLVRGLQDLYQRLLAPVIHTPYLALVSAAIVILIGLAVLPFLELSLLPSFKQTDLLIQWEAASGTSQPEMNRIVAQASHELRSIPGVRNVGSHVGRAITGDAVVAINAGAIWVSLDPAADYDATVAAVRGVTDGYPGLLSEVQTYQPERTTEALLGSNQDLVVRIYGHELDLMYDKMEEVRQSLSGLDGIAEVQVERQTERPQLEIEVDLAAAERHQMKPGDVRRQATTLLSGLRVGNLYEEQKVFDVVVWGVPEIRSSLTAIQEMQIDTPGGQVALGELADVRIVPSPTIIRRDVVSRFVDVGVKVSGRDIGAVAADIERRLQAVEFPLEYHAEVLGVSVQQQAARQRLLGIVVAAVIGIFLLMQASFESWRLAFFTCLTLPMALTGGVLAALAGGGVLSLGSLFGFLAVFALAVRNSMVMASHFQHLKENEGATVGPELVLRGARERVAPILMTALATGLFLLPMTIAGSIAGTEIVQPMAIVILGGLITSTLLNLFVLPSLYLRFTSSPEPAPSIPQLSEQPGLSV